MNANYSNNELVAINKTLSVVSQKLLSWKVTFLKNLIEIIANFFFFINIASCHLIDVLD